jgi:putative ABC transport system permease protein
MNPWPVARAALLRRPAAALAMLLLVALATALGVGVLALERGLRQGAARAADPFDLVIGAPGSPTTLVLAAVYLQAEAVPLLPGSLLARLAAEPGVAWLSPIGFGDRWGRHPVVGVAPALLTQGGRLPLAEGSAFASHEQAVVGARVPLALGARFVPQHGQIGLPGAADAHAHAETLVVGRMAPSGTPWDHAILVPIEAVWELHGLGTGHAGDAERLGPPWDAAPGVPAIVIKPRSFADAYALRARYRTAESMAVFPAEVLVALFRTMGDLRRVLSLMAGGCAALVIAAVFLAFAGRMAERGREFATLRALGAPRRFVLAAVWLELAVLLGAGVALGLALGWAGAWVLGTTLGAAARVPVATAPGWAEAGLGLAVLGAGLLAALLPALAAWRRPVGPGLR